MRFTTWNEDDLRKGIWQIPAVRMKMRRPHVILLSNQVRTLFKQLRPINEHYPYILPEDNIVANLYQRSKESISQIIELLGYKKHATGHKIRHTMSTILHE